MVDMVPITSSNIAAVGWSQQTGLVVQFRSGATYRYPDAPQGAYLSLVSAPSPGSYFARFVKSTYDGERA